LGKFATGHHYFLAFAKTHHPIVSLPGTFARTHHLAENGKLCILSSKPVIPGKSAKLSVFG
jgi:hypothetical protein